ncbi:penicillin-binding transpeptidase domain-containing protein [Paenibacillus ginsengarvi]|uniref:Penicillin-binding transpeptidase domain-containing protein n=1 Tax=Paenibacillus ginsengarvi TaxID=400777 RepID=A0A3B0C3G0_9BACL|nr:penicillin-binding transpeptidase domain-containing protein [Paenibacillus ginsengarvi]RKN80665.1 penicillin-binding transpeptidase domain-containing protein [Paenibacillus ginsengarvi]
MNRKFACLYAVWIGLALALIGCGKEQMRPEEAFQAYLTDWRQQQFAEMYGRLTPEFQAGHSQEEFVQRYRNIYDGIGVSKLMVEAVESVDPKPGKPQPETDEVSLRYRVAMDTVAGPLQFEHVAKLVKRILDGETKWDVDWNASLLFPSMKEGDKVRVTTDKGERGEILDRSGVGLAINGTAQQVGIVPGKLGDKAEQTKARLAEKLGIGVDAIGGLLGAKWVKPDSFVPIGFVAEAAEEQFRDMPGVTIQSKKMRVYPLAEAAAHITGYIGEISAEQLERLKEQHYAAGDLIGKSGLEQLLETRLRGHSGARIAITDADGNEKALLARKEAEAGETVRVTIDAGVQQALYKELQPDAGSAAAIQPVKGDILALVSSPSYDPNAFQRGLTSGQYNAWNTDPKQPFLNRFTKAYAPGSAFKLVTAAIGLDGHTLDPNERKNIPGLNWSKDSSWGNYYVRRVHESNPVNLQNALVYSDNIYFAQAALAAGKEAFASAAARFGIGEELPLAYPFQKSQLANNGIRSDIQLADSGYGQGEVTMTSLHAALVFAALVNKGDIAYPVLTDEEQGNRSKVWKARAMTPDTAELLTSDLVKAVAEPGGPGHGTYIPGAAIAGKTGTAEYKRSKNEDGLENGWFVGFNSADPQVVLSVMVEDVKGRGGSGYVTKKVKRMFQQMPKQ